MEEKKKGTRHDWTDIHSKTGYSPRFRQIVSVIISIHKTEKNVYSITPYSASGERLGNSECSETEAGCYPIMEKAFVARDR